MKAHATKVLEATRAGELMSGPVVTLEYNDTMHHAAALLLDKDISGAPVLDQSGRPAGVLTATDIVRYEREHVAVQETADARAAARTMGTLETIAKRAGFHEDDESEEDRVWHWMTPKVFAVDESAPLSAVLREMSGKKIHRLFVRDSKTAALVGVITTFDLMRFLAKAP